MNNLANCKVDDLMRVLVPQQIRETMGWDASTALVMATNGGNTVTLSAAGNCNGGILCHLDEYNRITLPKEVCESVSINAKDAVTLKADVEGGMLTISA